MTLIVNLVWYLSAMSHRMLNVVCFLDHQWPMRPRSTPPTILVANRKSKAIHYSWNTPYLDSWKIMPHESLILRFHGPWNTLRRVHGKFNSLKVLFHGFMKHEILCDKFSWKIQGPWISGHTKFMSYIIKSYSFIENSWPEIEAWNLILHFSWGIH